MMPMGTNFGEQNGEMSFLHINYYEQRAKGGTGLLIVEKCQCGFSAGLQRNDPAAHRFGQLHTTPV